MSASAAIEHLETVVLACEAMATRFEFVLCGEDGAHLRAAGEEAIDEILLTHDRLTRFARSSVVSAINEAAGLRAVGVDSELFGLFGLCERVRRESGGAFDVTRGGGGVELDPARSSVRLAASSASVDLGGVGKGFGLDMAADVLRDAGIESALLQGGTSTAVAIGPRPDGEPWVIEVPAASGGSLRVAIRDEAVSVSEATSSRGAAHVVDPSSGAAAAAGAQVAVCVAESAAEADAWSTAMIVRPAHAGMRSAWWSEGEWVASEGWQR